MKFKLGSLILLVFSICFESLGQVKLSRSSIKEYSRKIESENFHNLYQFSDSLFRSEQPKAISKDELKEIGIKSILNLRDDFYDSTLLGMADFHLYSVKMQANNIQMESVEEALKIIEIAPKPLLIHCKHGADRTGLMVAIYRIEKEGWSKEMAIYEMKRGGFGFHDKYLNIPKFIKAF